MTMIKNEQLKHGQQEKWFNNFHENLDLNVTAQELEQQPDFRWELLENRYSQYSELSGKIEKHRDSISLEAQQQGNQIPQTKISEACVNDLLILAQSAEIVAQSEDSVAGEHTNNQKNKDLQSDLIDQMSQEHASNINVDVTRTRLTQIRKQARCKYLILDQERDDNSRCKHSQGKTIRLNQIKHQARCKSKNDLAPQMISRAENEQPKGRILRLSQMKHRARSKGNSTVKDGTEKHMDQSLPCNRFKDNKQVLAGQVVKKNIFPVDSSPSVEDVPAHNFRGAIQSSVVRRDIENLKEHQRIARRLRAFKTKKLRQQFRRECKRSVSSAGLHAMGTSLTGLKAANSEAQKEFVPVKRLRLSQLRREARLGNPFPAMQGLPGN
ncbi:hypothetical protein AAZX31_02G102200 [Glycine max]|uniref:Uncharacterized protein n=2 Tax=Glycine subgen. Soja TaxID=1462606 RepID=K7K7L4_SOYBN|nr:uncharacterized protein LOC102660588 isoform X1 [Glycine max]XP_028202352.1 uncharacterized protein LOC114386534 isoform X1 [Glycine soja]KAG4402016.1 hypothetical protein GLYMA_02G107800v4 [Glycine max]KAH1059749.1 hypothetical protein GYH30_003650 [Glycine max]KAH1059756.1 hypothetical protein GYH30_003650 [Glycine max]KAH1059757.1 hypothetical protein GYH30_003650 [Glycine max]KAH1261027.1 hypothetical protein GmHk_02G003998 [Glycine max]|eukprot:XP_006574906.1 uncharacterized protein LOC102660588 isoform X1 [Glycine max]